MLCGEAGSIDLTDFLKEEIKGPASFTTTETEGGSPDDRSVFSEPAMNDLISSVFNDKSIYLQCLTGECLARTEVPGYETPVKQINTPVIAGVIAGCSLFLVFIILLVWYLSRRQARWGPVHLPDDEDDEGAKLMVDHKPAALYFRNVSYRIKGKQLLTDVQGVVHPGELLAIMGASGAGKTTFLDILARKNKRGEATGEFYVNGEQVLDDEFRSVTGFVDQDDTLLSTLTVDETIMDSALLRLPKDMSYAAKRQRVEDVERQLGIFHIRHQQIGSEESGRGISGGEKRRVGIACELVTSPSILFLDEPTSGLDAYNAYNVVECLVNLVKTYNRTVIFTIHQPRSNIVALFDNLILLANGRAVYSGPFSQCQAYFDNIGFPCPPGFNIGDYLVDLTMHAGTVHTPIDEDSSLFMRREGSDTRASSTMAIKSIPSISSANMSYEVAGSPSERESLLRPKAKRKSSIRQQQERQLFTRKKAIESPQVAGSSKSDDEASIPDARLDATQQWLKMNRQSGAPPPQILDDPDELPPAANGATGTDLDMLVAAYNSSDVATTLGDDTNNAILAANAANGNSNPMLPDQPNGGTNTLPTAGKVKGYHRIGHIRQYMILAVRTWRNLYRNPMLMLTHYAIAILLGVFLGFLFFALTDDVAGFQNRLGLFLFLLSLTGFSTLTSLSVFAPERSVFMRERAKGYYSPLSYFAAKLTFDIIPLRLFPPLIMGAIVYPMTGLLPKWPQFLLFLAYIVLFNLAASGICLFIGIVVRNQGVANLIGILVMLFSLLFSGLLLNHNTIHPAVLWLQMVSPHSPYTIACTC
jgi:ABC-type multidrug transport system ATPase subunit